MLKRPRWYRTAVALAVVLVFAASSVGLATEQRISDHPVSGTEALELIGSRLNDVAAWNGLSGDQLTRLLESDPYLYVDPDGALLYMDPPLSEHGDHHHDDDHRFDADSETLALPPLGEAGAFALNSKPGSQRTIYLDFDGHTLTNTAWNNSNVPNGYQVLPYDTDGNPGSFSAQEQANIRAIWARVAEDFAPFDVNVTTQYPGEEAITRSGSADQVYGTRIVITNSSPAPFCGGCGGVAYVGVFDRTSNHAWYQPAFCFSGSGGASAKNMTECISHEVGHNLGLRHDGIINGTTYYSGHSPWTPIMGVGFNQPVSQWSKGEYSNANNQEDDLAVMVSYGIPVRADDHGNTTGTATPFPGYAEGFITSQNDADYFRFVAGASGTATFHARPAGLGPNLDIHLTLFASNGSQLAEANPTVARVNSSVATGLDASIQYSVSAGLTYYLRVQGTGHGSPLTGYSKYASLGAYTLTASGVPSGHPADSVGLVNPATGQWFLRDAATGQTTTFYYGVPGDEPFMGDWNGDGIATPGLYRKSTGFVYLRSSNSTGAANLTFHFGAPGDLPIVGDFNGNGRDSVSVYRPSTGQVFIMNSLPAQGGTPIADLSYYFGNPGDKPFAGDFNGNGVATVGLHRESTGFVYFRNTHTQGSADAQFYFGTPRDFILSGKWLPGANNDTVGIFRPAVGWFFLRHTNSQGNADQAFAYGNSSLRPVYGHFGTLPGSAIPPPGN